MTRCLVSFVLVFGFLACSQTYGANVKGDVVYTMQPPRTQIKSHTYGNMKLVVSNWGFFGNAGEIDKYLWSCEYPANSGQDYLYMGALWIGGIVDGDTFVSVGADGWVRENELFPGPTDDDTIMERSIDPASPHYWDPSDTTDPLYLKYGRAISEQDLIAVCTDTVGPPYAPPDHRPMGIKITQQTYCWSHDYITDFILMKYWIGNIRGDMKTVEDIYVGLYIDADVTPITDDFTCIWWSAQDDITGFRVWRDESDTLWASGTTLYLWNEQTQSYDSTDVGGTPKYQSQSDYITQAWVADDDGSHPEAQCPGTGMANSVTGARVMYPRPEKISYNWWITDAVSSWGPCHAEDPSDVCGTPMGDSLKYRIMSNGYFDPDQVCDSLEYPPGVDSINDTRYLLSFGPNDLPAGDTLVLMLGYVGGEHFHNGNPWCEWSFEDLALNANWAYILYDNPGVDTDSSGYAGDFIIVAGETVYVSGDGIPDFRVPDSLPPPTPKNLRITSFDDVHLDVEWEPVFMKDIKGYLLYRSKDGSPFAPITDTILETSYSDSFGLDIGAWYYYRVTAMDTLLQEGTPSNVDSALFGRPHPPTGLIVDTGTNRYLDLAWQSPGDPDLDSYSIYRRQDDDTSGYARIDFGITDVQYRDTTVTNGIPYWYEVTALDLSGLESEPSNEAWGLPMGFDSGILLVDATRNMNGLPGLPTDEQVDRFYHKIVAGFQYTDLDNSDETHSLTLVDLSPYSTLVWHSDDVLIPSVPPEDVLTAYMQAGGNVWLVGYQLLLGLGQQFLRTYGGVDSFLVNEATDFVGAGGLSDYSDLEIDTNKVLSAWNGAIPNVSVCYPDTSSQAIYGYDSRSDSAQFEGKPCAFARFGSDYNFVGFWFPFYPMKEDSAVQAGRDILEDFGEVPTGVEERFTRRKAWKFELRQNFPNPFSGSTRIQFTIPQKSELRLDVYDICGRLVANLADMKAVPGLYEYDWDGADSRGKRVANGVYFYRLKSGGRIATKKMVYMK